MTIEEMKKFEDLFIDSQRKHSAPVISNGTDFNNNSVRAPNSRGESQRSSHIGGAAPMGYQRREILTITVDIGSANGETANILIREGDDPH